MKQLGSGSTAKVVLAFDRNTGERVAIKIVKRQNTGEKTDNKNEEDDGFNDHRIYREILISTLLDHPYIVKLLEFLYSDSHFFLIFEYIRGRQLYHIILKEMRLSEDRARKYFRQILSAIDYVHRNSIVHRDLKIENIVVDHNDNIKILDFGLSNFYDNKNFLKTFCGSLYFAAPELLHGMSYTGPEVDIWSLGIILYVMLCGKVPFDDENIRELQNKIKIADFEFISPISKSAKSLISSMIIPDVSKRFTMTEILKSKWLNFGHLETVENYVGKRFPLSKLDKEYVKALEAALSFQFPDVREDLESFYANCKNQTESLDTIYWTKNPVVSMYYLLSENVGAYAPMKTRSFPNITVDGNSDIIEALHRFVRFVFSTTSTQRPSKYFFTGVFQDSSQESTSSTLQLQAQDFPSIHKSYVRGIFQGIKVKHIGSPKAFKRIISEVFRKHSVVFEVGENSYYCTFYNDDEECYFKATLYFNVLFSQYFLVLKCLNSKKKSFQAIFHAIEDSLRYR